MCIIPNSELSSSPSCAAASAYVRWTTTKQSICGWTRQPCSSIAWSFCSELAPTCCFGVRRCQHKSSCDFVRRTVNMFRWKCFIPGKPGTDWEGGFYPLTLEFTEDYPAKPPKVSLPRRSR